MTFIMYSTSGVFTYGLVFVESQAKTVLTALTLQIPNR